MRVLVTGGSGYIGGRLREFLASCEGYCIVSASRSVNPPDNNDGNVVVIDWLNDESLRTCCSGMDSIVHLAAMNAADCVASPVAALEINTVATARLLQAAVDTGVRRFLYLSTAHVYGSPLTGRISEATCANPRHPYATSHRAAEDVVMSASDQGQIEGLVMRLSNAFGRPASPNTNCWTLLFNDLCRQAAIGQPLRLRTSGLQRRDFITMMDVCRAIRHLLELPWDRAGARIFNVGGAWSPMVIEAAALIAERYEVLTGNRVEIHRPQPVTGELAKELTYDIGVLNGTGFMLSGNPVAEIDDLLTFSQREFGGNLV
jgi:UDP-glucose 4-epimerase